MNNKYINELLTTGHTLITSNTLQQMELWFDEVANYLEKNEMVWDFVEHSPTRISIEVW